MFSVSLEMTTTVVILLLTIQWTQSTQTDVKCDPDVPSRPQPKSNGQPIALAQGDDLPTECPEGEYLDWYKCSPCEDGTFRTKQMALSDRFSKCEKCQTPVMYEIVAEPCTTKQDAKIMCEDGLYRYEVQGKPCQSECIRCDICGAGRNMFTDYVGQVCSDYTNTICCPRENMVVIEGKCLDRSTTSTTSTTTTTKVTITSTSTIVGVTSSIAEQSQQKNYIGENNIAVLQVLCCILLSIMLT